MNSSKHNLTRIVISLVALAAITLGGVASVGAQTRHRRRTPTLKRTTTVKKPVYYTVASGKTLRVRINESLSSKNSTVGETFTSTVVDPVYATNGEMVIPSGSIVNGVVTSVVKAQRKGKPGTIDVAFRSVTLPNGLSRAINGSLTDLNEGNTTSDNEGTASGGKMNNRHLIFIGGGAGAGLIIGALAGGGKGAGIGGLIGGGAGVAADLLLKGPEAQVKSGTEFGVILNQAVALPPYKSNV
ncbi:MAG: hypothetical protein ABIP75_06470 [Pyrinomonadaceae bacterium]